jgi:hypothetical protein
MTFRPRRRSYDMFHVERRQPLLRPQPAERVPAHDRRHQEALVLGTASSTNLPDGGDPYRVVCSQSPTRWSPGISDRSGTNADRACHRLLVSP